MNYNWDTTDKINQFYLSTDYLTFAQVYWLQSRYYQESMSVGSL
jgi:hypothetical protein